MKKLLIIAVAGALLASGCGQMLPATNVTSTTATLNAEVRCTADVNGTLYWETLEQLGEQPWVVRGDGIPYDCPPDQRSDIEGYQWAATDQDPNTAGYQDRQSITLSREVSGLRPATGYSFRIRIDFVGGSTTLDPLQFRTADPQ